MKTNLFLLVVVLVGGWYLFTTPPPPPMAAPTPPPVASVNRTDLPAYRSPLNDSAVTVGANGGSQAGYPASGLNKSSSLTPGTGHLPRNAVPVQPSSPGLRTDALNTGTGEPTLDLQRRADAIGNAAKGE